MTGVFQNISNLAGFTSVKDPPRENCVKRTKRQTSLVAHRLEMILTELSRMNCKRVQCFRHV